MITKAFFQALFNSKKDNIVNFSVWVHTYTVYCILYIQRNINYQINRFDTVICLVKPKY